MDIIKYSDLFDESSINSGLKGLISQVEGVKSSLLEMLKEVKEASSSMSSALSSTTSASKDGREDTRHRVAEVEQLYSAYKELTKAITECDKNIVSISESLKRKKRGTDDDKKETLTLADCYATLSDLISKTGVSINELLTSQRQLTIAHKNGEAAAKSATGSYNQLYAQYNLIKNVLNAMSAEMRNAEGVGKLWEAEALRIMDAMKGMQEATGKHTLSVGDYSKAFNGLSIATQQVLREMPVLANSMQQFFIAISNNVPIFVDNLRAVQRETGSWRTAMKAVLSSIFSWQTALLVLLTILPRIAKSIHDKRKAQEEDNKSIKEAYELTKLEANAQKSAYEEVVRSTNKLKVLYSISTDVNRSWKDRISAAKEMKSEFKDELANISAEEIALGKAKGAIDTLTSSLVKQAEAKAYLNEISQLTIKAYDLEKQSRLAKANIDTAATELEIANANRLAGARQIAGESVQAYDSRQQLLTDRVIEATKALDAEKAKYAEITEAQANVSDEIEALKDRIDPSALLKASTEGVKSATEKTKDYYWEWRESVAKALYDVEERELALNDVKYEKAKETYQKVLEEQRASNKLTEDQEKYLTEIIVNLEKEREQSRLDIIKEFYEKKWKAISEGYENIVDESGFMEEDLSITNQYNKVLASISSQILGARGDLNDKLINGTYAEAKAEGKILNDLLKSKLEAQREYELEVLAMRKEVEGLSDDEYKIETEKINSAIDKAIAKLQGKRRRKTDIWDMLFGKTQSDEYGNVFKVLDDDAKLFAQQVEDAMNTAIGYMNEWISKRIEMAEVAVEAAQKESEAAKEVLDNEMEARANGYAHNVDLARREYEEKLAIEKKAVEEKKRLEAIQEGIDTISQISSLLTTTALIWQSAMKFGIPIGPVVAGSVTAALFGSFLAAKVQAAKVANAKTYGEGGTEYINYGGSHASGNDVDFGSTKDGRPRRIERGEMVGVINKRNVSKYGIGTIEGIIGSLNNGTFELKYGGIVNSTEKNNLADMYSLAFAMNPNGADLSNIEKGIETLVSQNELKVVPTAYGRIEYRGNNKRIIRKS